MLSVLEVPRILDLKSSLEKMVAMKKMLNRAKNIRELNFDQAEKSDQA